MGRLMTFFGIHTVSILLCLLLLSSHCIAGENWERLYPEYPTHGFNDIYSESTENVFAVGNHGLIYHFDGLTWAEMDSPVTVNLHGVWGKTSNEVYVVGDDGTILLYNGTRWQKMKSPTSSHLFCVWGLPSSSQPVYIGGRNGEILALANGAWEFMETPLSDGIWNYTTILSIWGDSSSNLYAIGQKRGDQNEAIYLSWSGGSSWVREDAFTGSNPTSVRGFTGHDVYISCNDGVYRLINGNWENFEIILTDSFNDIWGSSHESIWFAGYSGITSYNGTTSTVLDTTTAAKGSQVTGNSATDLFTVTGSDGEIFHFQGQAWSSMTAVPISPANSICGYSDDALFAVGDNGVILFYDGIQWSPMESPTNNNLYSVCGGGNAVIAAGEDGTVLFYNGSQWSQVNSGTDQQLYDTWCRADGAAYIVGSMGTVLNCTGGGCSAEPTGTTATLYAVHHSDMGSYAGGNNGVMLHKATTTWNQITSVPAGTDVIDLWGHAGASILLAGGDEYIYSYNSSSDSWTPNYQGSTTLSIAAMIGTTSSDLYVIGRDGTSPYDGVVLHRENGSMQPIQEFPEQPLLSACLIGGNLFIGSELPTTGSTWGGTLFQYDMTSWSGLLERRSLRDVWGRGPEDLFVVGDTGTVMHYDGTSWLSMDSGTTTSLESVYAGENGSWALAGGGYPGEIIRFDGTSWAPVTIPTNESIADLWGTGSTVYAVGRDTVISSVNQGKAWLAESTPVGTSYLEAIWGAGLNGPLFAAGIDATILHSNGDGSWSQVQSNAIPSLRFHDIWGSSGDDVYAVGDTESVLGANESQIVHYDGQSWKSSDQSYNVLPPQYLNATWGRSKKDIFVFGSQSFRKDKCSPGWELHSKPGLPPFERVWGMQGADDIYYLFAIADTGNAVYQYTLSGDRTCSSSWPIFLPAILSK